MKDCGSLDAQPPRERRCCHPCSSKLCHRPSAGHHLSCSSVPETALAQSGAPPARGLRGEGLSRRGRVLGQVKIQGPGPLHPGARHRAEAGDRGSMVAAAPSAKSLQLCLTLCDPMDCSPPGFSVHGILQARILEWGAVPSLLLPSLPQKKIRKLSLSTLYKSNPLPHIQHYYVLGS